MAVSASDLVRINIAENIATAVQVPRGFRLSMAAQVQLNAAPAYLLRYEREDGLNSGIGGEHVSAVIDLSGKLIGYARMDASLEDGELPEEEEALAVACDFLRDSAADIFENLRNIWIRPHYETLQIFSDKTRNKCQRKVKLKGMKVKFKNIDNDRYAWVIVSPEDKILCFERDIEWVKMPGVRKTEKWLDDMWLSEQDIILDKVDL